MHDAAHICIGELVHGISFAIISTETNFQKQSNNKKKNK